MVNGNHMEVLFSGTDIDWHTRQKRLLQPVFAMSHIVKYESGMDDTINVFIDQLHARFVTVAPPGRSFDAMTWFTFFSLDVVTQMAFGARYGFLEQGIDVDSYVGTMHMIETLWLYVRFLSGDHFALTICKVHADVIPGQIDSEEPDPALVQSAWLVRSETALRRTHV